MDFQSCSALLSIFSKVKMAPTWNISKTKYKQATRQTENSHIWPGFPLCPMVRKNNRKTADLGQKEMSWRREKKTKTKEEEIEFL